MIYYSLIYPHLQYGISSWGGTAQNKLEPLIVLQKRIIRNICHRPARSHTNELFLKHELLKLGDIYKLQLGKLMHRHRHEHDVGQYCLVNISDIHTHNTRMSANNNFHLPQRRINLGREAFAYAGPKLWATVPTEFKFKTFIRFKKLYKKYLVNTYNNNPEH